LIELIKQAAVEAVQAEKPVSVMFGQCAIDEGRLIITVEQKLKLSGEMLVVLKGTAIQAGDSVVMLREQGGQRFVVMGVM